jgi:hypothetical protein
MDVKLPPVGVTTCCIDIAGAILEMPVGSVGKMDGIRDGLCYFVYESA